MQTSTTPQLIHSPATDNINMLLEERVGCSPDAVIMEIRSADGSSWSPVTTREFYDKVTALAKGLIALDIAPGSRVGIMAHTSFDWALLDFAIWAAGAVPVPIYETSSVAQMEWIIRDAEVSVLFVEAPHHQTAAETVQAKLGTLAHIFTISAGDIDKLIARGDGIGDAEVGRRRGLANLCDLATIIYTSGTTGNPKGAMLSHGNFVVLIRNTIKELPEIVGWGGDRTLLFLPLAHVFARFIHVLAVASGTVAGHTSNTANLVSDLSTFQPTFLLAVPRVFEKVYNAAEQKAAATGKVKIFRWAARVAISWSRARKAGHVPFMLGIYHKIADKLVLSKIRRLLGGKAKYAISGGAALGERLGHFYHALGFSVLEGYGLTETTAPTAVNRPHLSKIGSVGLPMPGTVSRIGADGEIEVSGYHVFMGYQNNPEATAEVFTADGFFKTGDVGRIDEDGYVWITGRKKEIIVTAGGKNVAPAVLEDRLRSHAAISQVVVVGEKRPFIGALITLDPDGVPGWLATHGQPALSLAQAAHNEALRTSIEKAVQRANRAVSRAESIRKWVILDSDLTEANGYLTPSLKVKRDKVLRDFAAEIDDLYGGPIATD